MNYQHYKNSSLEFFGVVKTSEKSDIFGQVLVLNDES